MKKIVLVGNTGFVGSNLCASYKFDKVVNSKNVCELYGQKPDVLVYAGVTGTKWLANQYPEQDNKVIESTKINIEKINPQKLILISTVDVYNPLVGVDEDSKVQISTLHQYGKNRACLENWVREHQIDYNIIRLPAIYGMNLKKNFLYDMIHIIPSILSPNMMDKVLSEMPDAMEYYSLNEEGNYKLHGIAYNKYIELREKFANAKVNALSFTNSDSEYQFYNLKNLWNHIQLIIEQDIKEVNLVSEPVAAKDVYAKVYGKEFFNNSVEKIKYNITSKYSHQLQGKQNYLYSREEELEDINEFAISQRKRV